MGSKEIFNRHPGKDQDDLIRDMMTKEIMKKIERRIDNEDKSVMNTLKTFMQNEVKKQPEEPKKIKKPNKKDK